MEKKLDIVTVGECLLELSTNSYFENTDSFNLSFGGDVVTTSTAAKKLGANVGLITVIGDDYFKDVILKKLNSYCIDLSNVRICSEKNGIYLCGHSERKELMTYKGRFAGNCLSLEDYNEDYIKSTKAVYTTGITQSLSVNSNELVKKIFKTARENDIITAYDPNYSSSFMTMFDTKEYLEDLLDYIDVLFLSLKQDKAPLYDIVSIEKIVNHFLAYGIKTIVIKSYIEKGYYIYHNGITEFCEFYNCEQDSCSMGAGDVFNGGFLAALIEGYTPFESAKIAAKQAGLFIERMGVINNIPNSEELLRL